MSLPPYIDEIQLHGQKQKSTSSANSIDKGKLHSPTVNSFIPSPNTLKT